MSDLIRIVLIDDQTTIRQALQIMLEQEPSIKVVGGAADGYSGLELVKELQPDIVLVDIEMPGLDGIATTEILSQNFPNVKALVLSGQDHPDYLTRAFQAGAKGYLLKNTPARDLIDAIRAVQRGYSQISPGLLQRLVVPGAVDAPSPSLGSLRVEGGTRESATGSTFPMPELSDLQTYLSAIAPVTSALLGMSPRLQSLLQRSRDLKARLIPLV